MNSALFGIMHKMAQLKSRCATLKQGVTREKIVHSMQNDLSFPKLCEIWRLDILWQDTLSKREHYYAKLFLFRYGAIKSEMGRPTNHNVRADISSVQTPGRLSYFPLPKWFVKASLSSIFCFQILLRNSSQNLFLTQTLNLIMKILFTFWTISETFLRWKV